MNMQKLIVDYFESQAKQPWVIGDVLSLFDGRQARVCRVQLVPLCRPGETISFDQLWRVTAIDASGRKHEVYV